MTDIFYENIYYLGPDGSNAQNAMFKFIDICNIKVKNKIPQKTIKSSLDCLINDNNSVCILPIENSIEGIVRETIDNLLQINDNEIKIRGELSIPIKHLLLSKSNDIKTINKIISHPQALAQCSNYLYKNFKNAEIKEVSSTSYAAQKVSKENDISLAAIANEACSHIFNLNILSDNINDEKDNQTRFYILGRHNIERTNNGKTSIIFSTKNEAGALCSALQIFSNNNINLTYIDSRPSKKKLGQYLFFVEVDGFDNEDKIHKAIEELNLITNFMKILGSFSVYKLSEKKFTIN